MRAVIYSRVSTDAQERDGTSLDTQERACIDYATAQGWQVVDVIRDAASGFSLDRPGIERVRAAARRGVTDIVIAYAVDRLARNQNHIGVLFDEMQNSDVKLDFVTEKFEDTAIGRFILAARAFTAEVEREKIAERTMRGKGERARAGKIPQGTGKGIFGYRYDRSTGRRQVDYSQAAVVRRVFEAFCAGAGCSRIAGELNREGLPAFGGGTWHPLTVRRMLLNETYTGRTVYRRTQVTKTRDIRTGKSRRRVIERPQTDWIEVADATPALIDRSVWERAQAILRDPERRAHAQPQHEYALRGHVRCAQCGTLMVGQAMQGGRYRYYRCRRAYAGNFEGRCSAPYVRMGPLEDAVRREIARVLANPALVLEETRRQPAESPQSDDGDFKAERRLADVLDEQSRLARLFVSGSLPEDVLAAEGRRLAMERSSLEAVLAASQRSHPPRRRPSLTRDVQEAARLVQEWVSLAAGDDFRLLLDALDVRVSASPDHAEIAGTIPAPGELQTDQSDSEILTIVRTSA